MEKKLQLIGLYYHICAYYNNSLQYNVQRFSANNLQGEISDEELMTIYLYCMIYEEKQSLKSMHKHIQGYWQDWFPSLPSYQTFVYRINRLCDAFMDLVQLLLLLLSRSIEEEALILGDSFPIITCSGKRSGKVAQGITNKGYCSSKDLHYYGVKLHALALRRTGKLPLPQFIGITQASIHDLNALRPIIQTFNAPKGTAFVLDKAYADTTLKEELSKQNVTLITPIKDVKNMPDVLKKIDLACKDIFNTSVAKIRQPIEALFSWLNQKTGLQNASIVRSEKGLKIHVFARIAAALFQLI